MNTIGLQLRDSCFVAQVEPHKRGDVAQSLWDNPRVDLLATYFVHPNCQSTTPLFSLLNHVYFITRISWLV